MGKLLKLSVRPLRKARPARDGHVYLAAGLPGLMLQLEPHPAMLPLTPATARELASKLLEFAAIAEGEERKP